MKIKFVKPLITSQNCVDGVYAAGCTMFGRGDGGPTGCCHRHL